MIKYAKIDGYNNLGEIQMFSHLYQFIENDKETPMIILIHAYEEDVKIFKGYVFNYTKTYKSVPINEAELNVIEQYVGKAKQIDFNEFIIGTIAEDYYEEFTVEQ
jgi:hypothetical protein